MYFFYKFENEQQETLKYLKVVKAWRRVTFSDYTNVGEDDELPLGQEFQQMLQVFIKKDKVKMSIAKRYAPIQTLIQQLE